MQLFLTSSIDTVAKSVAKKIGNPRQLKVAFVTTASEVEEGDKSWVDEIKQALIAANFNQIIDYTFTNKNAAKISKDLQLFDIILLNGGNVPYLLKVMHQTGAFQVVKDLILKKNKIYIGSSAGAMVAGSSIKELEKLDGEKYSSDQLECLNFTPFAIAPHWGSDDFKKEYFL